MRFRSGRISRYATEMSPNQQFPFKAYPVRFPNTEPDHHLNPHYNPRGISKEQPRGFPKQSRLLLSSFAIMISRSNNRVSLAEDIRFYQLSLITTQGRLRCPQHSCEKIAITPSDRFNPVSYLSKSIKNYPSEAYKAQ